LIKVEVIKFFSEFNITINLIRIIKDSVTGKILTEEPTKLAVTEE